MAGGSWYASAAAVMQLADRRFVRCRVAGPGVAEEDCHEADRRESHPDHGYAPAAVDDLSRISRSTRSPTADHSAPKSFSGIASG